MAAVIIKGGERAQKVLADLQKKIKKAAVLRVGFLEGATYPDGMPVANVAAIQEFGAPAAGIPPRSFFRPMVKEKSPRWGDKLGKLLVQHDFDVDKVFGLMGQGIKGQLQQSIIDINDPPLSEITLMLRQMRRDDQSLVVTGATVGEAARRVAAGERATGVSTKPLNDTGHMLDSVDYEVSDS